MKAHDLCKRSPASRSRWFYGDPSAAPADPLWGRCWTERLERAKECAERGGSPR